MGKDSGQAKTLLLMVLLALWLAVYAYSVLFLLNPPGKVIADGPGLSPMTGFLGWQGVAGMFAFACWGIGWSFPKGAGVRRVSGVPLGLAVALVIVGSGMAVFGG
ncbi:MAG: hypothetical protein V3U96_03055 [Paracoccaceae bacterium]